MLDIRDISQNPEFYINGLNRRNKDFTNEINEVTTLYKKYLEELKICEDAKALVNEKSKLIGTYKREGKNVDDLMQEIAQAKLLADDHKARVLNKQIEDIIFMIPNVPHQSVTVGADEDENVELRRELELPTFDFDVRAHYEIGEIIEGLDFERAAKLSKSRFVITKGLVAKLERSITNYMLDTHTNDGYLEFGIPVVVNDATLLGSGQLPKFEDDLFKIHRAISNDDEFMDNERDFYLVPTGEVVLGSYHANEFINLEKTLNYTAFSQCFRKEAGSAGRDTRGLIRVHQFGKVELFKYCHPDNSYDELGIMVNQAEKILKGLKLPYRVVELCTGDMGFGAAKTIDLEVWLPSQNTYRECSSCSNVEDFQARRGKVRFKDVDGKTRHPHMLNGSGMATGRILAAVLENYQNADGTINIPDVLKSYMGM